MLSRQQRQERLANPDLWTDLGGGWWLMVSVSMGRSVYLEHEDNQDLDISWSCRSDATELDADISLTERDYRCHVPVRVLRAFLDRVSELMKG